MTPPLVSRVFATLTATAFLAGCGEPLAPTLVGADRVPPTVLVNAAFAADLGAALTDVDERILPSFTESYQLGVVRSALKSVASAATTRSPQLLSSASKSFGTAVESYTATRADRDDDPDLSVLRLTSEFVVLVSSNPPLDTLKTP
ncbi:MAG TPA: hypothetical protein VK864_04305 [Longimicrobiales bacterium]|nr:hypothetical protein [Longimicrobiales bacterium]